MAILKRILVGRPLPRPSRSTSASRRRSRWRSSRRTRSRRRRTRPRRSSSSPPSARRASRSASTRSIPIAIAVAVLLAIVVTSYRQTIFAYPSGGGSYVVSRENLGENPSLVAGASLLVDYILTVAVSISAGVAAIISIPAFRRSRGPPRRCSASCSSRSSPSRNLRGIKESGRVFAVADLHLHRHAWPRWSATASIRAYFGRHRSRPVRPRRRSRAAARPADARAVPASSRASRRARSRSPVSRRSPTACPRSGGPSRRTRPRR